MNATYPNHRLRAAVFLDKDGTLLTDVPHNVEPACMHFAPGAAAALRVLAGSGLPLHVISNQPGVAFGYFSEAALDKVRRRLALMFAQCGATLTGFHCCPHHEDGTVARYARRCGCRKPAPGLLLAAARAHRLHLQSSWMIGDILDDVEAGHAAGCRSILVNCGGETQWCFTSARIPDAIVPSLEQAALHIVRNVANARSRLSSHADETIAARRGCDV
jgi:histidinol-phosphate phosphatase family protein